MLTLPHVVILALTYFAAGYAFWSLVVVCSMEDMAKTDPEMAVVALHEQKGEAHALVVRAVVVLLWPLFLAYGLATSCTCFVRAQFDERF